MSRVFLISLFLLILNDFVLKPLLHNWFTGKLSDFAGLFIFPLFWTAFLPRWKNVIYCMTGLAFLLWKSVYSQLLIDAWNHLAVLPIYRTVDPTDYVALLVLPLSYLYSEHKHYGQSAGLTPYLLACISVVAFAATSYRTPVDFNERFYFQGSRLELTRKIYHLGHLNPEYKITCSGLSNDAVDLTIRIPCDFCGSVEADIAINDEQHQTVISLEKMEHRCPKGSDDKRKLLAIFKNDFIGRLRQIDLVPSTCTNTDSARTSEHLNAQGQIYFVQIGDVRDLDIVELANEFRRKYKLPIKALPKFPLTDDMRSPGFPNTRPIAKRILDALSSNYQHRSGKDESIMIGFTNDMTTEQSENRTYNFALDLNGRLAVISTEQMNPSTFCEPPNPRLLQDRVRKVVYRVIGGLYYHLPSSADPKSVLYNSIGCVDELDNEEEHF